MNVKTHRPRPTRQAILLGLTTSLCMSWRTVEAADRVYLKNAGGHGEARVVGNVEDYTGEHLVLRNAAGRQQTFPADRVVRIESDWPTTHQLALSHFQQRSYQESLDAFLVALRAEKRQWVQRQQLAKITWCYRNLGKMEEATLSFLALYRSDPTTMHFSAIPLIWFGSPPNAAAERRAATLLADTKLPVGQLIGASWLLTSSKRTEAMQTLRSLANADDARIIFLAEAQMWRTQLATLTDADVERMQTRVDSMPPAIRGGPYFLLGAAEARRGEPEQAALALMRIPINFPEDGLLAAQALLAAGEQLDAINRTDDARGLYREIMVEFAGTAQAATAQQRYSASRRQGAGQAQP